MDKEKSEILERLNRLIGKDEDITILEKIRLDGNYFSGKIEVSFLNELLSFQIKVPNHYPLTHPNSDNISIIFKNEEYVGLEHINLDGSVCFHPDKDDDFDRKFIYELKCLKQWIRDYYIIGKQDENYSYLVHTTEKGKVNRLYFTNTENKFDKNSFGEFDYSIFTDEKYGDSKIPVKKFFRLGFRNGEEDKWSKTFRDELKSRTCKKGIYYFIEDEPIRESSRGRKGVETWDELNTFLSDVFIDYLHTGLRRGFGKSFFHENNLLFLIGYRIPNLENYEEHWDLIRISKRNIPVESRRIPKQEREQLNKMHETTLKKSKILWGTTENIDYTRFFGRGKLNDKITNSHILIIGCGALGSSLAEILARGGVKNLSLEDFDNIRGGNLCRANYHLYDMIYQKTERLTKRLKAISPFLNTTSIDFKLNSIDLRKVKEILDKYIDVIFDCSADPEVTFILDKVGFKGDIFSLAITNNAKSLVSITGPNLTKQARSLFAFLENSEPTYIEGTGCGYPTFEANYNDINYLLHTGLKIINNNYSKNRKNETFVIKPEFESVPSIDIIEYNFSFSDNQNSSIHIPMGLLNEIEEITRFHYPNEFGGVFVGYRTDRDFIITDLLLPDKFENGRAIFIRHPGSLNQRLSEIHRTTNGKIEYLGEWHSHPDGPTKPSKRDFNEMKKIARDKKISIAQPLLMIVAVSMESFSNDFYIYNKSKLNRYEL
ncbi:ThiF family adenylyltransferase [Muricauda oceani]|uniref:Thiamine biosynthesis protein ThiF n=1 Tax=Flagellimonas oceani TaxID=2698672 RepID=A0A6G7J0Z6_9FLAO|nr:ThiF family adenylyltransferase [Allomuricauda oceani]MBW8244228.1 ThiF family adenylyltransferase [Allomuricauda oceani]QII44122.1 hypothetical protein GVT53_05355 [Allomuricauda oceani]